MSPIVSSWTGHNGTRLLSISQIPYRFSLLFLFPFFQKPHEDGPAYHPVVATLSLGSHAVFHYYRYADDDNNGRTSDAPLAEVDQEKGKGRPIQRDPILSLLLEPRSLVITTSTLYTSHLHGVSEVEEDIFLSGAFPTIANLTLLKGGKECEVLRDGGVLKRGTRFSLTCRDVEKVASGLPGLLKR